MTDWKNEDEIKAELRTLTAELRRLREGLRNLVSPPKANPSRAFLHRQSWPSTLEPGEPAPTETESRPTEPEPRGIADDRKRPKGRKKKKKP